MNNHKGIVFIILFLLCVKCNIRFISGEIRCTEKEREALLMFKQGLIDESGTLSSWGHDDESKECCKWKGIRCSNTTGHVIAIQLGIDWQSFNQSSEPLRGKLSSALLELRHLNSLDLSSNDFGGIKIPKFIGSIKNLRVLKLRECNFDGTIPPHLGNLTNLRILDLSDNSLSSENLDWLSRLSFLNVLNLSQADLRNTSWLQQILKLPSLTELHLESSSIVDVTASADLFVNYSSFSSSSSLLSNLHMSYNQLTSFAFDWLFNISLSLSHIDLSYNQLDGPIPRAFGTLNSLVYLDLSQNLLKSEIPKSLGNLSHLETLSLSHNGLGGKFEEFIGNLSTKTMVSLESVDLSYNQLAGTLPDMRALSRLRVLYIGSNKLIGTVPLSIGQLSKLEVLDLSFNSLQGTISEANLVKLDNLKLLDLSFNSLTMKVGPHWNPPFQLYVVNLACCNVGPDFPKWIRTQRNFTWLDLSRAGITDEMPKWLWNLSTPTYSYLNISHNQIRGTIPHLSSSSIDTLDVSYNKFSGPIPFHHRPSILQLSQNMFSGSISSICTFPSSSLTLLDLSNNQLGGELPKCWEKMKFLRYLNLANNSFSGEIPHSLGSLQNLQALHLRDNNFSGELPSTLKNCRSLELVDVGRNKLGGNIPAWIGAYKFMMYLSLGHNRFYGDIPPEICNLTLIQVLDLSENNISGEIPHCFDKFVSLIEQSSRSVLQPIWFGFSLVDYKSAGIDKDYSEYVLVQWKGQESEYRKTLGLLKLIDLSSNRLIGNIPTSFSSLKGLISLNLSRNSLTGKIIQQIDQMEMLEILDLSRNRLSGEIPIGLAQLHYLAVLDLANNNLSGKIPIGTQLQSFNACVYGGNAELCGLPLALCAGEHLAPTITGQGEAIEKDKGGSITLSFMQEFCISIFLGSVIGFWGVVGSLLLKRSWRRAYFNFLDEVGDWLYVTAIISLRKFRRR